MNHSSFKILKMMESFYELVSIMVPISDLIIQQGIFNLVEQYIYYVVKKFCSAQLLKQLQDPVNINEVKIEEHSQDQIALHYQHIYECLSIRRKFPELRQFLIKNSYGIEKFYQDHSPNFGQQKHDGSNQKTGHNQLSS